MKLRLAGISAVFFYLLMPGLFYYFTFRYRESGVIEIKDVSGRYVNGNT
jgi:hypothetical protein